MNAPVGRVIPSLMLVGFIALVAGDEARCQVPRGYFDEVRKLGPGVNTSAVEAMPYISADGLTLYYMSTQPGGFGRGDLYQATRSTLNDPFGKGMNLGAGINSSAREWIPVISSDGLTVYFSIPDDGPGGFGGNDIYQATRPTTNDEFDNVMNLGAPISTSFHDDNGDISADGLTLYFSSDRGGDNDLYMATRESVKDGFANVTSLGTEVNGPTHELSPRLSADGLLMFFSEVDEPPFRPGGHGRADIWVAMRTSTDEPFGNVVNLNEFSLGSEINGSLHDFFPTISHDWPAPGSKLYFHRYGPGMRGEIWQATWFPEAPLLQAGDADQDLDFDQLDLVQVQVAAKYLTGQTATWGEGDWNGAPGGSPGNPPPGDGLFDQLDIIAAQQSGSYLTSPHAAIQAGGEMGDGQTSLIYNAGSGEVAVDAPAGVELTSINIDSAAGIFTGQAAANLGGSFDNDADNNIFKATFGSSFGSVSFGNVAQPGLSADFVAGDLTVVGSLAGGGDLGAVDLIYVPEPETLVILSLGLASLGAYRWRRRRPAGR